MGFASFLSFWEFNLSFMQCLMAVLTKCNQIVRSITSRLTAFNMMHMQFDIFIMRATALAGVSISMKYILSCVVEIVLFSKLIVCAYGKDFPSSIAFKR